MNVHQMSAHYVPEQDRILLRISTTQNEEMRLWLTRRLMRGLWPLLNQAITQRAAVDTPVHDAPSRKAVAEFEHEAFLQKNDFTTPYKAPEASPLGSEPLLVSEVHVTPLSAGQVRVHFQEKLQTGMGQRGFQLELAPQLSHGLVHLLDRALLQALWDLNADPAALAASPHAAETPGNERPKYLN